MSESLSLIHICYGLKLRMKDPTRESYAVYDENQSCSDVMPELSMHTEPTAYSPVSSLKAAISSGKMCIRDSPGTG